MGSASAANPIAKPSACFEVSAVLETGPQQSGEIGVIRFRWGFVVILIVVNITTKEANRVTSAIGFKRQQFERGN